MEHTHTEIFYLEYKRQYALVIHYKIIKKTYQKIEESYKAQLLESPVRNKFDVMEQWRIKKDK